MNDLLKWIPGYATEFEHTWFILPSKDPKEKQALSPKKYFEQKLEKLGRKRVQ